MESRSPWDSLPVWRGEATAPAAIAAAAQAMAAAFPAWSRDHAARLAKLRALATILTERRADVVDLLIREAGKCRTDAEAEAALLPKKVELALGTGLARTPLAGVVTLGKEAMTVWRPRGVAVVLGPYNFPLHLLHGLVAPALAVGCTLLAKPSDRCPALGELYRRCLADAGLDRVCTVVQGGTDVAAALIDRAEVATVAAVGGRAMGEALSRRLAGRP